MFVRKSRACDEPNSSSPMTAAAIAAQNRRVSSVGYDFTSGDNSLFGLISRLGGNPPGVPGGDAGVPTTGRPRPDSWLPAAAAARAGGSNSGGGIDTGAGVWSCVRPEVVPFAVVLPVPVVATPRPLEAKKPKPSPAPSVPQPAACVDPPECAPTPANICRNIRDGCYLDSQTSMLQKQICSWAGWAGNTGLRRPCPGGWNKGAKIPDLNMQPRDTEGNPTERAPFLPAGVAGIGPDGDPAVYDLLRGGAMAAGGLALLWIVNNAYRKGRR